MVKEIRKEENSLALQFDTVISRDLLLRFFFSESTKRRVRLLNSQSVRPRTGLVSWSCVREPLERRNGPLLDRSRDSSKGVWGRGRVGYVRLPGEQDVGASCRGGNVVNDKWTRVDVRAPNGSQTCVEVWSIERDDGLPVPFGVGSRDLWKVYKGGSRDPMMVIKRI